MAGTLVTVVAGVVFGIALAAPPGPMNAIIAEETVVRGYRSGVVTGLGAMVADILFFLLAVAGVGSLIVDAPRIRAAIVGCGGILMVVFGVAAIRDARSGVAWDVDADRSERGFWKALLLGLTNPYQLAFWLTVGIGLLQPATIDLGAVLPFVGESLEGVFVVTTGGAPVFLGLFGGIGLWVLGFPATLHAAGQRIDRFAPAVALLSAVVLLAFGLWFLLDSGGTLLGFR